MLGCWTCVTYPGLGGSKSAKPRQLFSLQGVITQSTAHISRHTASPFGMASVSTHSHIVLRRCLGPRLSVVSCGAPRSTSRHAFPSWLLQLHFNVDIGCKSLTLCNVAVAAGYNSTPRLCSSPLAVVFVVLHSPFAAHGQCLAKLRGCKSALLHSCRLQLSRLNLVILSRCASCSQGLLWLCNTTSG